MKWKLSFLVCIACCTWLSGALHADWNRFRGPNGTGIAEGSAPTQWSPGENLKWKLPLPGAGFSSPIVVGNKVFVTSYTGSAGNNLSRQLTCVDATSGKLLWQKDVPNEVEEDPNEGMGIPAHGYASHTPTSDGQRVYAFFGKTGIIAFDMDGQELWRKSVGTESDPRRWGSASSPILADDVLVVTAGPESRAVVGLDKNTGEQLWTSPAEGFGNVWGTPALISTGNSTDLVIGAPYEIWAINAKTGKLSWYCEAMDTDSFNSSVVVYEDKVYGIEGRGGGSIAVKAGGKDDVTKSNVLWTGRDTSRFGSPVVVDNRLYYFNSGVAYCVDAMTGKEIFKGRLRSASGETSPEPGAGGRGQGGPGRGQGGFGGPGGPGGQRGGRGGGFGGGGPGGDYASPVYADGKIYFINRTGETYVIEAGDEFNQLAVNRISEEAEQFGATPAISGGSIFIRSNKHLYCISQ
ncbi:MAG: PQQ-binding-like beta-propeller repeat protein [Planctomycetales bacterium]|nr:PQQ-binding-like beta-propeller repeat protein [Planctomycetales bacterium]